MCLQPARPAHPRGGVPQHRSPPVSSTQAPELPRCLVVVGHTHASGNQASMVGDSRARARGAGRGIRDPRKCSQGFQGSLPMNQSTETSLLLAASVGSLGQTGLDGDSRHSSPLPSSTSPPGPEPSSQASTWCSQMPFSHESHTQKWEGGTRSPSKGTSWVRFAIQSSTGRPAAATRGQHSALAMERSGEG